MNQPIPPNAMSTMCAMEADLAAAKTIECVTCRAVVSKWSAQWRMKRFDGSVTGPFCCHLCAVASAEDK